MRPRLIHPVPVEIERVDHAATQMDDLFKEPTSGTDVAYATPETITAQIKYTTTERRDNTPGGETPLTSGYLIYPKASIQGLKKGDRIKSISGQGLSHVYVIEVQPTAAGRGSHYLEKAVFQERRQG